MANIDKLKPCSLPKNNVAQVAQVLRASGNGFMDNQIFGRTDANRFPRRQLERLGALHENIFITRKRQRNIHVTAVVGVNRNDAGLTGEFLQVGDAAFKIFRDLRNELFRFFNGNGNRQINVFGKTRQSPFLHGETANENVGNFFTREVNVQLPRGFKNSRQRAFAFRLIRAQFYPTTGDARLSIECAVDRVWPRLGDRDDAGAFVPKIRKGLHTRGEILLRSFSAACGAALRR